MKLKYTAAILATLALATSTQAALITGSVELTADASTITINPTTNKVTFSPASPASNAKVDSSTGDLATLLPTGSSITYKDFTYDPLSVTGGNPIWKSVFASGNTWFDLTTITNITEVFVGSTFQGLVLFGEGTINTDVQGDYVSTAGTWSFNASKTGAVFSWGSTTTSVPDGGATLALLSVSLLGLGGARRFLPSLKK